MDSTLRGVFCISTRARRAHGGGVSGQCEIYCDQRVTAMQKRSMFAISVASALALTCPSASATPVILRSAIPLPADCQVTPVYGDYVSGASPFIIAQPRFTGIVMRLSQAVPKDLTYEPLLPTSDVLLRVPGDSVVVEGVGPPADPNVPTPSRFSRLFRTDNYQRLQFPVAGCWHLRLQAGAQTAYVTLWVQHAPCEGRLATSRGTRCTSRSD